LTAQSIYGFNQKTPQGKDQPPQTAQEAALESSQEAHLAAVICRVLIPFAARGCDEQPRGHLFLPRKSFAMQNQFTKHYTRDEARALLPQIRQWLERLGHLRQATDRFDKRLGGLAEQGNDIGGDMVNQWIRTLADMQEVLAEFQRREIFIKDLSRGLIDFPAIIGGKEVFLCWEQDEEDVEFWHDLETGYGGRERL
jgi:hypothetical protein